MATRNIVTTLAADLVGGGTLVLAYPQGTAKGNSLSDGRPAAGKTGTNENLTSVMFAGYTTDLAAVLWYGNPDAPFGDPVNAYGASLAPYNHLELGQPMFGEYVWGRQFGENTINP